MKVSRDFLFVMNVWQDGGTERVFEAVVKILKKQFPESKVYLYTISPYKEKYLLPDGVCLLKSIWELLMLKKTKRKYEIINFSGYWKSGAICYVFFKNYISWCHNNPYILKKAKSGWLNFFLLKKSKHLVCICKEQAEILSNEFGFKNNLKLIYNPIDIDAIQLKSQEHLPSDVAYRYILMNARFELAQKDYFTLIKAFSLLSENCRKSHKLVLLGSGPDEKKVRSFVTQLGLADSVIFRGYDSNPYKWEKNAELCVLSSKYEGISIAVLETMACKTPLVLTEYKTGAKELSDGGKNAVVVKIGDEAEMALAIENLLENKSLRQQLINNAFAFVQQFSLSYFEGKLVSLFGEIE